MDLGCGNGILSNQLESKFNIKIDRIDANEETLLLNKKIKGKVVHQFIPFDIPVFARLMGTESEKAKEMLKNTKTKMFDSNQEAINGVVMETNK